MPGTTRTTVRIRALALAAVVLVVSTWALPHRAPHASAAPLAAGSDFTISSEISSSATIATQTALLHPGVTRYLWFTVSNPLPQPITVTSVGVAQVRAPATCPLANLDLGDPTFTGALVVPANASLTVPAPKPISLRNLPVNQDACKNVTFTFTFTGTGWYSDSPTGVGRISTATMVEATPNAAFVGTSVTLKARVIPAFGSGSTSQSGIGTSTPTGTVTFHLTGPDGELSLLGSSELGPDGSAVLRLPALPPGNSRLRAVYTGTGPFEASTSPTTTVSIIAPPAQCTARYTKSILGNPATPVITGTKGNDFIYAVGGNYRIKAGRGNDCVVVGDGNNVISDGSGADVVIAGNGSNRITLYGSRNTLLVGNGDGNRVTVKGTKKGTTIRRTYSNVVTVGDGSSNQVLVGTGSGNFVRVGDGSGNRVTVRTGNRNVLEAGDGWGNVITVRRGQKNSVTLGDGSANRVTVGLGTRNKVTVGDGSRNRVTIKGTKARVVLGAGTTNRVVGRKDATASSRTTCSLPDPPGRWRGKPARYYRDTLIRCAVVTR